MNGRDSSSLRLLLEWWLDDDDREVDEEVKGERLRPRLADRLCLLLVFSLLRLLRFEPSELLESDEGDEEWRLPFLF